MFLIKKLHYLLFGVLFFGLFSLTSCSNKDADIISTVYPGYDFVKAVLGSDSSHTPGMLVKAGTEIHDFEPSAVNIHSIINSKLFIYVGGEDDKVWVEEKILPKVSESTKVISMFDCLREANVHLLGEEKPSSAEEEEEEDEDEAYDAHVWTSPKNAIIITKAISKALIEIDPDMEEIYTKNTLKYVNELLNIDNEIKDIVSNAKNNFMVFGDRFPLLYFVKEYGINYDAAFTGCSSNRDASSKVIIALTDEVMEKKLSYIFILEMSSSTVAKTIKDNIDKNIKSGSYSGPSVEVLTFYSMQNIEIKDFNKGLTYVDFMKKNIEALKLALN